MLNSSLKFSTVKKRFKELRLLLANSIVRNNEDISALLKDIASIPIATELLDEYSIRYLLIWLATKYGFDEYTKNIDHDFVTRVANIMETLGATGWYPFQNEISLKKEMNTIKNIFAFLDEKLPQDLEYLGLFYEFLTTHSLKFDPDSFSDIQLIANTKYNRRIKGQFYTPPDIVSYCLKASLNKSSMDLIKKLPASNSISNTNRQDIQTDRSANFKVLDPALGSGNFLTGILSLAHDAGLSDKALFELVSDCLYGIDIDGRAVSIARFSLILKLLQISKSKEFFTKNIKNIVKNLGKNLMVSDSTLLGLTDKAVDKHKQFDLVITNPPYVSFGARNQQVIPKSLSLLYKKFYPNSSEYKIRLNSIFHDIAYRFTKPKGRYALLVPDSFLTGRRYSKLRASILSRSKIISLTELPDNTIQNATVGRWCLAVFENTKDSSDYEIKAVSYCDKGQCTTPDTSNKSSAPSSIISDKYKSEYQIPISRLESTDHQRLQLVFNKFDDELVQLFRLLPKIKTLLRGHTGIRSRIGQKAIIDNKRKGSTWQKGLVSGSSIQPFETNWKGYWINIDSNLLYSGGFDNQVIENEKILLRQTGDSIVASIDNTGLYHLNNIHSFSSQRLRSKNKNDSSTPLHVILAWMNSNLWRYLYRLKTREDGRALAQIDIETVQELPIPEIENNNLIGAIDKLSKSLCNSLANQDQNFDKVSTLKTINRLVYASYGISKEQILYIENDLSNRNPNGGFVPALPLTSVEEALKISQSLPLTKARIAPIG